MFKIVGTYAREIVDAHGWPTVEVRLMLDDGFIAVGQAPTMETSVNSEESELRDKDPSRFEGLGVLRSVDIVNNQLGRLLEGKDPTRQLEIDTLLADFDGTGNWSKIGTNTAIAVSQAVCKAGANANQLPVYRWIGLLAKRSTFTLPTPIFTMLTGGARGTGNTIDFRNFYLIPQAISGFGNIMRCGCEIYQKVRVVLADHKALFGVADDGGYAPNLFSNQDAFLLVRESAKKAGYSIGQQVNIGVAIGAQHLLQNGSYMIRDRTQALGETDMYLFYKELLDTHQVFYLEDSFAFADWNSWTRLQLELGTNMLVVADEMIAGNPQRLTEAAMKKAIGGVVITLGQSGTVSGLMKLAHAVQETHAKLIVASRTGETEDALIADFAVGVGAEYCKFGAPARGEHISKYNRLAEIEIDMS